VAPDQLVRQLGERARRVRRAARAVPDRPPLAGLPPHRI